MKKLLKILGIVLLLLVAGVGTLISYALLLLPNVGDVHTSFSLGEVKSPSGLPLGHL
jgi:hypothetical protein